MLIKLDQFRGLLPRIAPVALPIEGAQTATNCLMGAGSLRPLIGEGSVTVTDSLVSGTKKKIFKYTGNRWLAWTGDVDACRGSVAMDAYDRLYWTGDGVPKMGDSTVILSGSSKPGGSYSLGIPKPADAPTLSKSGAAGKAVDNIYRAYVYTYVSAYGEEGPPSDPTLITISPGNTVTISGMSTSPGADHNIASKNIYRAITGSNKTDYQYLASVSLATTSTTDTTDDALLGEVIVSRGWIAPNASMIGLVSHPGGFLVGFYNNVLCPSEPYMVHAYPADYQIAVDAEIVALGVYGNAILVTTKGMPYVVTGTTPGQLSVEKLESGESCICKRALVDMGAACVYPGPSGLWVVGTGTVDLITKSLMTKSEWSSYSATLQFALQYENLYIGFMTSGGFVLDTVSGDFTTHDITATGGWYDRELGKLYIVVGGVIKEWSTGSNKTAVWKSKKFQLPYPDNFGVAQIFAGGSVTVKIYADAVLKVTQTVTDSLPFRLPAGFLATNWEVQLESAYEITSVLLASSMAELTQ